jgi:hypothetical protein
MNNYQRLKLLIYYTVAVRGTAYFESMFLADATAVRFLFIAVSATAPTLGVIIGGVIIDRIGGN